MKLAQDSEPGRSRAILSRTRGVQAVIQTFPDEADRELKSLFLIEINASDLKSALKELRSCPEVEYVEEAPLRKLVR